MDRVTVPCNHCLLGASPLPAATHSTAPLHPHPQHSAALTCRKVSNLPWSPTRCAR